jgi:ABC-type spermidine/putrescine transport system permease subunit II
VSDVAVSEVRESEAPVIHRRRWDPVNGLLRVWGVLVYLFLFIPIAVIVVYSFNTGRSLLTWNRFGGFQSYRDALGSTEIPPDVKASLIAAVGSAIIATVLGTFAGIALARRGGKWVPAFLGLVFLLLVTPEIVDAVSLLIWFVRIKGPFGPDNPLPVSFGYLRLWVGHSLFSTAVVTLIVRARLAGLDESLEEAAADLYAPPGRRFRQITLPLIAPAVLAGALLSFSFSLDNTIVSTFVSVPGATPWPVFVVSALRSIPRPEVAAMSTLLLLVTLFSLGVIAVVLRLTGSSTEDVAKTIAGAG